MKDTDDPVKRLTDRQIQTVCLMVLAGVAGVYLVFWLRPVLVPFIVACFIVSGVGPILTYLENRFNVSRVVAAGMAFLSGVILMGVFGLTISFSIIDLSANSKQYRTRVKELVDKVEDNLSFDLLNLRKSRPAKIDPEMMGEESDDAPIDLQSVESEATPDAIANRAARLTQNPDDQVAAAKAEPSSTPSRPETPTGAAEANLEPQAAEKTDTATDEADAAVDDADASANDEPQVEIADQTPLVDSSTFDLPAIETNPIQVRQNSQPVESSRMQEATELVDAFVRDGVTVVLQAFLSLVSTSIVVLIYVFFLLLGKPAFSQADALREIDTQIRDYLSLKTVISIGTGALFGLTLRLFGVPMALSFGVLAFLLNFIPNIGPIVANLLPIPLILLDPSGNIFWMASVIIATSMIQLISGNVIEPKLMGNSSDLHPVTILLGLMFWGMMWGIIGMFLATPITAAIKIVLSRFEPTQQIANIMAGRWEEPEPPAAD
ncbi:MAG: AI-2E family transporter [Planctomycetales bacterium]|nr:AI-2E family transporter [Planctomycetales bacterium]